MHPLSKNANFFISLIVIVRNKTVKFRIKVDPLKL